MYFFVFQIIFFSSCKVPTSRSFGIFCASWTHLFKRTIFLIKISPHIPSVCFSQRKAAFRSISFSCRDLFYRASFVTPTTHVGSCQEATFTMLWPIQPTAAENRKTFWYQKLWSSLMNPGAYLSRVYNQPVLPYESCYRSGSSGKTRLPGTYVDTESYSFISLIVLRHF